MAIDKGSSNLEHLIAHGVIHPEHTISEGDQEKIESLTPAEVDALCSAKDKLGNELLSKTAKGGKFPHDEGISF